MNTMVKFWLFVLLILSPAGNAVSEEIVVIVNPAVDASAIDPEEIKRIYTGRSTSLTPYDLPENSRIRNEFYKIATGRNSRQIEALWARLVFSGRGRAPEELINSKAVKSTVALDSRSIGYIEKSLVDGTVRVVMTLTPEE